MLSSRARAPAWSRSTRRSRFSLVEAVHADTDDLERATAYDPDELGDLGWYAVQEIPDLLA